MAAAQYLQVQYPVQNIIISGPYQPSCAHQETVIPSAMFSTPNSCKRKRRMKVVQRAPVAKMIVKIN